MIILPQLKALSQCIIASPQQECGVAGALMEHRLRVLRTSIQAASETRTCPLARGCLTAAAL